MVYIQVETLTSLELLGRVFLSKVLIKDVLVDLKGRVSIDSVYC